MSPRSSFWKLNRVMAAGPSLEIKTCSFTFCMIASDKRTHFETELNVYFVFHEIRHKMTGTNTRCFRRTGLEP